VDAKEAADENGRGESISISVAYRSQEKKAWRKCMLRNREEKHGGRKCLREPHSVLKRKAFPCILKKKMSLPKSCYPSAERRENASERPSEREASSV